MATAGGTGGQAGGGGGVVRASGRRSVPARAARLRLGVRGRAVRGGGAPRSGLATESARGGGSRAAAPSY